MFCEIDLFFKLHVGDLTFLCLVRSKIYLGKNKTIWQGRKFCAGKKFYIGETESLLLVIRN